MRSNEFTCAAMNHTEAQDASVDLMYIKVGSKPTNVNIVVSNIDMYVALIDADFAEMHAKIPFVKAPDTSSPERKNLVALDCEMVYDLSQ